MSGPPAPIMQGPLFVPGARRCTEASNVRGSENGRPRRSVPPPVREAQWRTRPLPPSRLTHPRSPGLLTSCFRCKFLTRSRTMNTRLNLEAATLDQQNARLLDINAGSSSNHGLPCFRTAHPSLLRQSLATASAPPTLTDKAKTQSMLSHARPAEGTRMAERSMVE